MSKRKYIRSYFYGHPCHIYYGDIDERGVYSNWRLSETDMPIKEIHPEELHCPKCGRQAKETNGQDPCIANLPGVTAACCGHGVEEPYVLFDNGVDLRGQDAIDFFEKVKEPA